MRLIVARRLRSLDGSSVTCSHIQGENPRHDHGTYFTCLKCSRMVKKPDLGHRKRDLKLERRLTATFADEALGSFAESRTLAGPVNNLHGRDFPLEVMEELADARNYAVWGVQQLDEHPVSDALRGELEMFYGMVLKAVGEAFTASRHASRLWHDEIARNLDGTTHEDQAA